MKKILQNIGTHIFVVFLFGVEAILSSNRGQGNASEELKRILAFADKHDYSISLTVDSHGATTNAVGEKNGEIGLNDEQLTAWYSRYGFLFDKNSACGYRPKKSEKNQFKKTSIKLSIENINVDDIEGISDPETLHNLLVLGELEENKIYEDGDETLYLFKDQKLIEISNIIAHWDYSKNEYKLTYK